MTIPGLSLPELPDAEQVNFSGPVGVLGGYFWRQAAPAPVAVLLHGWGQDAGAMAGPARELHRAGWHALSLSQRGWCGSAGCDDYGRSVSTDLRVPLAWLTRQAGGSGPVVLLGFSMGGLGALLTASAPETSLVTHVVAVSAPTDLRAVYNSSSAGLLKRCYDAVLTPDQWHEGSPLSHAHGLRVPALVVVGTEDRLCPPEIGRQYALASGARLLEYPGMAHVPDEPQWASVVADTLQWVRNC
ncbi:alpha/beta hydrolase family protein [Deinococcus navajonensis]|uniref:Alpha/beta hydrolase family protein n=1 Tax=Deinococcus navajonensis TaxID=309884 RepID=A0ABV8XTD6_9DEIO